MNGVTERDIEKSCCGYIILGLSEKPTRFLLNFAFKKGVRPIVYADGTSLVSRLASLAKFLPAHILDRDEIGVESLDRHMLDKKIRRMTLICADPKFSGFIERNRQRLEKRFIIQMTHDTETENEA